MIYLANDCRYSGVKVTPKSWKTSTSTKKNWSVWYRFYCPGLTGEGTPYPKGKLVNNRTMNDLKDPADRKAYVYHLIAEMEKDLERRDFNPITGHRKEIDESEDKVDTLDPDTPFIDALKAARERKNCVKTVKEDLAIVIRYVAKAAKSLNLDYLAISGITRKHIRLILDKLEQIKTATVINKKTGKKGSWGPYMFNYYRAHLSMLFEELVEWEAMDNNPTEKIRKMKHIAARRVTMTPEQRKLVDESLRQDNYTFWRFAHIFFHSGARIVEMLKVKKEDVDLVNQRVSYEILKGKQYRREYRPIPDASLNLWEQALVGAADGQYIFSYGLKPGNKVICYRQIGRRWRKWVKKKHGIEADFYSLKHTHSTAVKKLVGAKLAALHNAHTEEVLNTHYDMEGRDREMEILKKLEVKFS